MEVCNVKLIRPTLLFLVLAGFGLWGEARPAYAGC